MIISAYFADNGIPKTGLTPTINIRDTDNNLVINGAAMTELAEGFYKYSFATFDSSKDYVIICDGGATLIGSERYAIGGSGIAGINVDIDANVDDIKIVTDNLPDSGALTTLQTDVTFLKDIEGGRWRIINNQMIFYKSDNITEVARFNLKDLAGNLAMSGIFSRERV